MPRLLRSPKEYAFQLRQEVRNVSLCAFPPGLEQNRSISAPLPFLPSPAPIVERLRGTNFAANVIATADSILQHRFPLLGITVETGAEIRWRRDYSRNIETGVSTFAESPTSTSAWPVTTNAFGNSTVISTWFCWRKPSG